MDSDAEMHSPALSSGADCLKSIINEYGGVSSSADTSAGDVDSELMDCLVRDVRRLSETLTELSAALDHPTSAAKEDNNESDGSSREVDSTWSVSVHQCLCNVLQVLKEAIIRYRFLQSNDIFEYIGALVDVVKGLKFDHDAPENSAAFKKAHATLENLQIAVAECVGEYLTWEMTHYEGSASKMSWTDYPPRVGHFSLDISKKTNSSRPQGADSSVLGTRTQLALMDGGPKRSRMLREQ